MNGQPLSLSPRRRQGAACRPFAFARSSVQPLLSGLSRLRSEAQHPKGLALTGSAAGVTCPSVQIEKVSFPLNQYT